MKARMTDDTATLDRLIADTERKAERAARLKDEWLTAEMLVAFLAQDDSSIIYAEFMGEKDQNLAWA